LTTRGEANARIALAENELIGKPDFMFGLSGVGIFYDAVDDHRPLPAKQFGGVPSGDRYDTGGFYTTPPPGNGCDNVAAICKFTISWNSGQWPIFGVDHEAISLHERRTAPKILEPVFELKRQLSIFTNGLANAGNSKTIWNQMWTVGVSNYFGYSPQSVGGPPQTTGENDKKKSEYSNRKLADFGVANKLVHPIAFVPVAFFCIVTALYLIRTGCLKLERPRWIWGLVLIWSGVFLAGVGYFGIFIGPLVLQDTIRLYGNLE
jgi:hypothetical protein